jgi:hypothetical protein
LLEQTVDKRGLAMVDVGDDGDIAEFHSLGFRGGACWLARASRA